MLTIMFHGIDLFSDTMTRPSSAMRKRMAEAEVGDEQLSEDPTTLQLEERGAEMMGVPNAVFLPSATMANQIALQFLCRAGDEVFASADSHIFGVEAGGPAVHARVMARPIDTPTGIFSADDVRARVRERAVHHPVCRVVSVENTNNFPGGIAWPLEAIASIEEICRELGIRMHLDGARVMNAAVALNVKLAKITSCFDTVTLCLSKGLGCPVGALLGFHDSNRDEVLRLKQLMGGALRQSGILAAAGLYAFSENIQRLAEDHENADRLRDGLRAIDCLEVESPPNTTNMVFFRLRAKRLSPLEFDELSQKEGLRFSLVGKNRFRAVTHLDIQKEDIRKAIEIVKRISQKA